MESPQHGALFLMMSLNASEDVRKNANSCDEEGSFVQHDAFGALIRRRFLLS